jgi:hypothetical protein
MSNAKILIFSLVFNNISFKVVLLNNLIKAIFLFSSLFFFIEIIGIVQLIFLYISGPIIISLNNTLFNFNDLLI